MVQILFFLSLLCITAMLLKLFWYLDDSYEEEIRINLMHYRHGVLRTQRSSYPNISDIADKYPGHFRTPISRKYNPIVNKTSSMRRPMNFYDVGIVSDPDDLSSSDNQTECA